MPSNFIGKIRWFHPRSTSPDCHALIGEVRDSKWAMILDEGNGLGALSESVSLEPNELAKLSCMDERRGDRGRDIIQALGESPPGLVLPLVLMALVPITWWLIQDS